MRLQISIIKELGKSNIYDYLLLIYVIILCLLILFLINYKNDKIVVI